jgi:hypothetical protein
VRRAGPPQASAAPSGGNWFLGSESKFAKPPACPKGEVHRTAAKLASDPNNQRGGDIHV